MSVIFLQNILDTLFLFCLSIWVMVHKHSHTYSHIYKYCCSIKKIHIPKRICDCKIGSSIRFFKFQLPEKQKICAKPVLNLEYVLTVAWSCVVLKGIYSCIVLQITNYFAKGAKRQKLVSLISRWRRWIYKLLSCLVSPQIEINRNKSWRLHTYFSTCSASNSALVWLWEWGSTQSYHFRKINHKYMTSMLDIW